MVMTWKCDWQDLLHLFYMHRRAFVVIVWFILMIITIYFEIIHSKLMSLHRKLTWVDVDVCYYRCSTVESGGHVDGNTTSDTNVKSKSPVGVHIWQSTCESCEGVGAGGGGQHVMYVCHPPTCLVCWHCGCYPCLQVGLPPLNFDLWTLCIRLTTYTLTRWQHMSQALVMELTSGITWPLWTTQKSLMCLREKLQYILSTKYIYYYLTIITCTSCPLYALPFRFDRFHLAFQYLWLWWSPQVPCDHQTWYSSKEHDILRWGAASVCSSRLWPTGSLWDWLPCHLGAKLHTCQDRVSWQWKTYTLSGCLT